jgi:hypothetical protein
MILQTPPPPNETQQALQRVLEGLLFVGILIQVVKGADILLRPHQQKWLQDKFDTLALWLDFRRPLRWYMQPKNIRRVQAGMVAVAAIAVSIHFLINGGISRFYSAAVLVVGVVMLIVACVGGSFFEKRADEYTYRNLDKSDAKRMKLADALSEWIVNSSLPTHIAKQVLFTAAGLLFLLLLVSIAAKVTTVVKYVFDPIFQWHIIIGSVIGGVVAMVFMKLFFYVFPYIEAVLMVSFMSALSLVFCVGLILIELLLKVLRGLVWRITEYNKGAYAAILLIITSLLAAAEVYLRFIKG